MGVGRELASAKGTGVRRRGARPRTDEYTRYELAGTEAQVSPIRYQVTALMDGAKF